MRVFVYKTIQGGPKKRTPEKHHPVYTEFRVMLKKVIGIY